MASYKKPKTKPKAICKKPAISFNIPNLPMSIPKVTEAQISDFEGLVKLPKGTRPRFPKFH